MWTPWDLTMGVLPGKGIISSPMTEWLMVGQRTIFLVGKIHQYCQRAYQMQKYPLQNNDKLCLKCHRLRDLSFLLRYVGNIAVDCVAVAIVQRLQ
jgi:hypothetical protein